jgi:transcriptional regulator with XRE-family HTH domain
MSDDSTFGAFLRARRERVSPAAVGLVVSPRRRTPGLRREELATLAGVSIDYLIRLEQGRDLRPSASVIASLAVALHFTEDERLHMASLVAHEVNGPLCPTDVTPSATVAPTIVRLLTGLDQTPAFVVGPQHDVLAWNDAWQRTAAPLGMLDGEPPNLARYVFLNPSAPTALPDWAQSADEQASRLRAASNRWGSDPRFVALIEELSAGSAQFATLWSSHSVVEKRRGVKRLVHPEAGEFRVAFEVLLLPDDGEQRMITWLPADDASATAMSGLLAAAEPVSPAQLRVVGGG